MKRRSFLKGLGVAAAALTAAPLLIQGEAVPELKASKPDEYSHFENDFIRQAYRIKECEVVSPTKMVLTADRTCEGIVRGDMIISDDSRTVGYVSDRRFNQITVLAIKINDHSYHFSDAFIKGSKFIQYSSSHPG